MNSFENFQLSKQLNNAIIDLGFEKPTPIQEEAFPVVLSGRDVVGIAQTGTGKTFAFMLPILHELKFSNQINPRILILVPTRELVAQMVEMIESFSRYISVRALGVYGGTNINTQKIAVAKGCDILVATPGRLYDLAVSGALKLKSIQKLVVDEVDIMLDLGFRYQLANIFELLPERRQNLMFSATMTEEVDGLINDAFRAPHKISIAVSGTPLDNIEQQCYAVQNFYTKVNLLEHLLTVLEDATKVLVFISHKKNADLLYEAIEEKFGSESCIIHSNKSQNYRFRSIEQFDSGAKRILITTDVMARGLDLDKITHVINIDTPTFPENYMHRIGRTGRAELPGKSILFYTQKEEASKNKIEALMSLKIPQQDFPEEVLISTELTLEERPRIVDKYGRQPALKKEETAFHQKKEKNLKTNQGGSYLRKGKVYKKPKTRGDKISNRRKK